MLINIGLHVVGAFLAEYTDLFHRFKDEGLKLSVIQTALFI